MNEPSVSAIDKTPAPTPPNAQRDRIRLAAVQLFTRQGFASTSMKQLAQALNMAVGNLYNYYPNKEAILLDVLENQLLAVAERDRLILDRGESPEEMLRNLAHDLVVNDLNDPMAAFVGVQGLHGLSDNNVAYISSLMGDIRSMWLSVIEKGREDGVFSVPDAKLCTLSILTLCSTISSWFQQGGDYSAEYVAEGVAELALRMAGFGRSD